jgi:hypothetical protein
MKRAAIFLLAFAFVGLMVVGPAKATPINGNNDLFAVSELETFSAEVTVDNEPSQFFDLVPIFADNGPSSMATTQVNGGIIGFQLEEPGQTLQFDGGSVTANNIFGLFDPTINAAIGVVDFGTPSSFAVAVVSPLVPPLTGKAQVQLDLSGSFVDGDPLDGGSATPFLTPGIAQATVEGIAVADTGPAAVFASPSDLYGPFQALNLIDCAAFGGTCDSFDLLISFTGSGGQDSISFTAAHRLNSVPEPAVLTLLGIGLLGMVWVFRKRGS